VRVRVFTRQHFGVGPVFGQPAPLPSLHVSFGSVILQKI
jgi:hypothetical protein